MKKILLYVSTVALLGGLFYWNYGKSDAISDEQARIEKYVSKKRAKRANGYVKSEMPELYAQIERDLRTPYGQTAPSYSANYKIQELKKALKSKRALKSGNDVVFKERGPGNVAGRTRALLIYGGDETQRTWMAGSVTGGIWITKDAGQSWEQKGKGLPNLGAGTLASSAANPDIVYLGTGEHFTDDIDGAGMFKSTDFGETWTQLVDVEQYPDFRNVGRMIVNPDDPNEVVAVTRNSVWAGEFASVAAIYKTTDGGESWTRIMGTDQFRMDDINYNPENFQTQYIAAQGYGILKSTDGGETWTRKSVGLVPSGRIEIDVSPVDTSVIWASVQGTQSGNSSDLYISTDGAENWNLLLEDNNVNFLGSQGWYDNIITAHPFNANEAYVGGINLWKFTATDEEFDNITFDLEDNGTIPFLDFVNGRRLGGGIDFFEDADRDSVPPVEIRFGQGGQKAYRFSVNRRGPGVPAQDYEYLDYVDVPFQVWNTETGEQLMVSFRDQQIDGKWSLIDRNTDAPHTDDSREYIFIHSTPYSETPDANITKNGGHEYEQVFFMWPVRSSSSTIVGDMYPESSLAINKFAAKGRVRTTKNISDAYFEHDQVNTFSSENFSNNKGMHPDQHNIIAVTTPGSASFRLIITNDGGIYRSRPSLNPGESDDAFQYAGFGYNTTQFYSADKAPGKDRYIGGMQDNSTWFTPSGLTEVDAETNYEFAFGGDGFEAIWHNISDSKMLGSIQFNAIQRSTNGGRTWRSGTNGLGDTGQGSGPFRSRLANSKLYPDRVFAVGSSGVWRSTDFAESWESVRIVDSLWSFTNSMEIEVSLADFNVVWAGGRLLHNSRLYVSADGGETFEPTSYYTPDTLGSISSIATHPIEPETAYALFSFQGKPKVLKTTDLGQTWEDISGFDAAKDGKSSRGFPDVAVNALIVFPHDTNHIWVGSEIGIVESTDGGQSWTLLDTPMGASNIYDFQQQDDQIVIATYGRGIWTAQSPAFQQTLLYPAIIQSVAVTPSSEIKADILFNVSYDSTRIFIDGEYQTTDYANRIGTKSITLSSENLEEREYEMTAVSYLNGQTVNSNSFSFEYIAPGSVVSKYFSDLSETEKVSDFRLDGFTISTPSGFSNPAIHSRHPYPDRSEAIVDFAKSVEILENSRLIFNEIGLIEIGEPGSIFGDDGFYDYAVVEGSKDGINWSALAPGYDANAHSEWLAAYNGSQSGTPSLIKERVISLEDTFAAGDTILLRFRLSSDPATTGWGWMIDDIEITNSTPTIDIAQTEIEIYPNPATDYLNLKLDRSLDYKRAEMYDLGGRLVAQWDISNTAQKRIDISHLQAGMYVLSLSNDKDNTIQKIIKQ